MQVSAKRTGHAIDERNGLSSGGISLASSAMVSFSTRIDQGNGILERRGEMPYIVQTSLNGRPQIKSSYSVSDDLDAVRGLYLTLIKNTSEEMERAYPGMVIQIPLKPGSTLHEGVRIMVRDGVGGRQGDVYTVELHKV
jgi:hypothetical protein